MASKKDVPVWQDFFGNVIKPGDWVVAPGAGARTGEKGQLLYWVEKLNPKSIKLRRLTYDYKYDAARRDYVYSVKIKTSNYKKSVKCLVVDPPNEAKLLFALAEAGEVSPPQQELVTQWLAGNVSLLAPPKA